MVIKPDFEIARCVSSAEVVLFAFFGYSGVTEGPLLCT